MRSIVYRFPDLDRFDQLVRDVGDPELELGVPAGETVEDGEWVLAIFELGASRKATSAAARAATGPEGLRLVFEPRDWERLAQFCAGETERLSRLPPAPTRGGGPPRGPQADASPPTPLAAMTAPAPTVLDETLRSGPVARDSRAEAAPFTDDTTVGSGEMPRPSQAPPADRAVCRTLVGSARVLVTDDDPDIREVVSAMLEAVGLTVVQAQSAEEALRRLREEPFDLMVLDWNLPKMTGIELCRVLRQGAATASIPVLFLTANASSQDMVHAFASGADDYVVKPFRAPELGARIFSLLRRSRLPQA